MAELFQTIAQNTPLHSEERIEPEATCKDYLQVRSAHVGWVEPQAKPIIQCVELIVLDGFRCALPILRGLKMTIESYRELEA